MECESMIFFTNHLSYVWDLLFSLSNSCLIFTVKRMFYLVITEKKTKREVRIIHNGGWQVVSKYYFLWRLRWIKSKHKQILESSQHGLEIIFQDIFSWLNALARSIMYPFDSKQAVIWWLRPGELSSRTRVVSGKSEATRYLVVNGAFACDCIRKCTKLFTRIRDRFFNTKFDTKSIVNSLKSSENAILSL